MSGGRTERLSLVESALIVAVFTACLIPCLSFDIIAGLSPLRAWLFDMTTLTGIARAHFGGGLGTGDRSRAATTVLTLTVG